MDDELDPITGLPLKRPAGDNTGDDVEEDIDEEADLTEKGMDLGEGDMGEE